MDDKTFEVALTKCYFCGESHELLMNRVLTRSAAKKIKEMHGKVLDMSPCNKCEDLMKRGVILITIDNEKSSPGWNRDKFPNPYRTGGFFVLKDEAIRQAIHPESMSEWALKYRWMFIEDEAARMMGLFEFPNKEERDDEKES